MKGTTFFVILLMTSGLLFTPILQPSQEIQLAPQSTTEVMILVRSTSIQLASEIPSIVLVNVTFITTGGDENIVQINAQLIDTLTIAAVETGTYELQFFSTVFGSISIDQAGITTYQLIYYTILVIAFLYVLTRRIRN